jgi:hydroxylaminobenzene mutase
MNLDTMLDAAKAESNAIGRSLVWHGAALCLLGLLSGFTTMFAKAPTAALSAHGIGLLQGAMLFGLAGAWPLIGLRGRKALLVKATLLIGFYANWLGVQLAALWSAKGMFMVSGAAMPAGALPWMEAVVTVLLNLSILVLAGCGMILWQSRAATRA